MKKLEEDIFGKVSILIENARVKIATAINLEMITLYWNIGRAVKESIIQRDRAEYGKQTINALSIRLTDNYGKGFSPQNLWYMVQLFETYPILHAVRGEFKNLNWTHIRTLLPIKEKLKREFYTALCRKEKWNTRTLKERINSLLFERTALSKLPGETINNQLMELKESEKMTPELVFRDPYVLDFLELHSSYSERDLENAILNALEKFILEFGKDFYFVDRQKRITIDDEDYYIDLLFYHRRLKCFVVIDLKLGKFKAEYKGKMELYVGYLKKYEMLEDDNPPVGLILCTEMGSEQIEILFPSEGKIRVARYLTEFPKKTFFTEKLQKAVKAAQTGR